MAEKRLANSHTTGVLLYLVHFNDLLYTAEVKTLDDLGINHFKLFHSHACTDLRPAVGLRLNHAQIFQLVLMAVKIKQLLLVVGVLGVQGAEHVICGLMVRLSRLLFVCGGPLDYLLVLLKWVDCLAVLFRGIFIDHLLPKCRWSRSDIVAFTALLV